ncbi:MAG: C10 family peptidase [Muribaculaceae bacterium]|nr:C10 family peptidase [Muribaculaceae bacterium]
MRKISIILAFGALPAMAYQISPDEALARATGNDKTAYAAAAAGKTPASEYSFAGQQGSLYVFNRQGNAGGFMVTSADSDGRPLYAVSDSGSFPTEENMPPAMKWLLEQYEAEAETQAAGFTVPDYYVGWNAISPLVSAKWDQGSPYNDRCPVVYNQKTLTGCVATAMAQIVYTHRYAKGAGKISYQMYIDNSTQSFNFATAKFDFAAMTDTYSDKSTTASREAVAELMEACGKSVRMSYIPGGSSAITGDVPQALKTYFGYDRHTALCSRWDYQTEQWETIIYNELLAGRPVYYSGSTINGGGHAFVCDGYDGNGLFHINWGWSGMSDGFFALPSLKPGQVGAGATEGGFSTVQQMVIVVPPDSKDIQDLTPAKTTGAADILLADVEISPLCSGEDASVTFTAINRGNLDLITNSSRLLLYNAGNSIVSYGSEERSYGVPAGDARRSTFSIVLVDDKGRSVAPGKYELRICDSDNKPLSDQAVFTVTVTDDKLPKDDGFTHSGQVSVGNAKEVIPTEIIKGKPFHISPSVRNDNASNRFSIGLALYKPGTDEIVWSDTQSMTCQNTNGNYIPGFPYLKDYSVSAPAGVYDAAFISDDNKIISARVREVRVGEIVDKLAFAPTTDGKGVSMMKHTYSGDIVVPESVTLSDGRTFSVTAVDAEAFLDLADVNSIDFPASLTSMGLHALRHTSKVQTIIFRGATVPFVNIAAVAYRMNPHVVIYVNAAALDAYEAAMAPFKVLPLDDPNAITEIESDAMDTDQPIYDLFGRRVLNPTPGKIYIRAGKKFRL